MANVFFLILWKEVGSSNKKWDLPKSRTFIIIFKFIDDLSNFNFNINKLENDYINIYPDELELKSENEYSCNALCLDFSIEIHNRKFATELFDKGMPFPFISIACSIWVVIYHLKYFMLQSILNFYVLQGQQQTWLIWENVWIFCWFRWKKQANQFARIILLLKKIFWKNFKRIL